MNAAQLAILNSQDAQPLTIDQQIERASNIIPLGKYAGRDVPVPNQFCHCAMFNAAGSNTPRQAMMLEFFPVSSGGYFQFEGPELRQDDETVLLHLLWLYTDKSPTAEMTLDPVEMCLAMGWTTRAKDANVERLSECLSRMKRVHLEYYDRDNKKRYETGLVWSIDYNDDNTITVTLSKHILKAYGGNAAYINRKVWAQLPKGLATWLFAHISSNNCKRGFDLLQLKALSGSNISNPREFARKVREAMALIASMTGYEWNVSKGTLNVFKG